MLSAHLPLNNKDKEGQIDCLQSKSSCLAPILTKCLRGRDMVHVPSMYMHVCKRIKMFLMFYSSGTCNNQNPMDPYLMVSN